MMISWEGKGVSARVLRRAALWGVLPLVLVMVAGWIWYQVGDTGRRWRYEDHLASYCAGLLPPAQTAALTGLRTDGLGNDLRSGGSTAYYWYCDVGDVSLTLSRVPEGEDDGLGPKDVQFYFPYEDVSALPATSPLGGGWAGYTDAKNTVASLTCENGGFVVVTALGNGLDDSTGAVGRDRVQVIAGLVTAAAARAADRWGCATTAPGGPPRVPALTATPVPASGVRHGTCARLPLDEHRSIAWAWGTRTDRDTLDERCVLSTSDELPQEQTDAERHVWTLKARYGSQALAAAVHRRNWSDETNEYRDRFRATARCPGSAVRARFSVHPSQGRENDNTTAVALLKAFVLRAAERHGCTDVRLPPPGTANAPPPWATDEAHS